MLDSIKPLIDTACKRPLTVKEAEEAFDFIMDGKASNAQIAGLLIAMRTRGETVDEIVAAASVMLAKCKSVKAPEGAIDVVGTGGDGKSTLNISTATALVVAGAGVPVAKHGNRGLSSKSGAADALGGFGVEVMVGPKIVELALQTAGIGFMMAPMHHPAMRHVMSVRQELATRTIFNILGPLTNPAKVKMQLTGAYSKQLLYPMAETLLRLGTIKAWLVHGHDGTDEISICGKTNVVSLDNGQITEFTIEPVDAGLPEHPLSEIKGGEPDENAQAMKSLLNGELSAYRDAVIFNSAAAILVANKTNSLVEGAEMARISIDSGSALTCANNLATATTKAK